MYETIVSELSSINIKPHTLHERVKYFVFRGGERGLLILGGFRGYEYGVVKGLFKLAVVLKRSYKYRFNIILVPCIDVYGFNGLKHSILGDKENISLNELENILERNAYDTKYIDEYKIYTMLNDYVLVLGKGCMIHDYNKLRDFLVAHRVLNSLERGKQVALYLYSDKYYKLYSDKFVTIEKYDDKFLFYDELMFNKGSWLNEALNSIIENYNVTYMIAVYEHVNSIISISLPRDLYLQCSSLARMFKQKLKMKTLITKEEKHTSYMNTGILTFKIPYELNSKEKINVTLKALSILCNVLSNSLS